MPPSSATQIQELVSLRYDFSPDAARQKTELFRALRKRRCATPEDVKSLHEAACFARAFPENAAVRGATEKLLEEFGARADVRRFRRRLGDSGIAGAAVYFRFYWLMAIRLAERWPDAISIDWKEFERKADVVGLLHLLVTFSETPALDAQVRGAREWIDDLKSADETDAAFLIRRFAALDVPTPVREKMYEDLDVPLRLDPGPTTPARGRECFARAPVVYRREPPERGRPPDFRRAVLASRPRVRAASPIEARELIDLANACMVSRHRDLLVFLHGDPQDVRIIDCGDGLSFACIGATPQRRLVLEAVYGFLTLMNGVPIGYVLCSALFSSSEIAYNIFETFRGRGAAQVYAKFLGAVHRLFGVDSFALDPYQLGHENKEGQQSGAWWFYYKLGFRPHDPDVRRLVREELAALKADRGYRTSPARINELAAEYMFLHLDAPRRDVLGHIDLGNIGAHVSRFLADRFGAERERGLAECARETAPLLGLRKNTRLSPGEKLAWRRWSPLALALPGIERWTAAQKRTLRDVMRAKGGRRESDFVKRIDTHKRLRAALLELSQTAP